MNVITVSELKARMDNGEKLNLLDVREPAEHEAFNIGGKLLPIGNILSMQTDEIDELRDSEIICYCRSGQRSLHACLMLQSAGFSNVKNLAGGMLAWQEQFPA